MFLLFFFFNDTATTEIYTLSLHDALPISVPVGRSTLGRVMNVLGKPVDQLGPLTSDTQYRSEEHTSELQSQSNLVCRLLLEKKKKIRQSRRRRRRCAEPEQPRRRRRPWRS